jgi:hypothetical protein
MTNAYVACPLYVQDDRRYLDLEFKNKIRRVKVPWRYGRVMCRVTGSKTVQELETGDFVRIELKTVMWEGLEHLVLESIECLPDTDSC